MVYYTLHIVNNTHHMVFIKVYKQLKSILNCNKFKKDFVKNRNLKKGFYKKIESWNLLLGGDDIIGSNDVQALICTLSLIVQIMYLYILKNKGD